MKRIVASLVLAAASAACGGSSSPAAPSTPTVAATRIITVSGDLAFGNVNFGDTPTRTFTIANSGNATLTYTGLTCAGGTGCTGYTASPLTGTVAPGASVTVTLKFTPTIAQFYSAVMSVTGDQTSGNAAINISGTGINNTPIFTKSGTGDSVFDMPTTVKRVRIQGTPTTSCQNFIVHIGSGVSVVNVILGTCSVADARTLDGTYLTTGGVVSITSSTGIQWTFTEVR